MPADEPVPLGVEGDRIEWSCGCVTDVQRETRAFVIVPCCPSCLLYRYVVSRMQEQGKPVFSVELDGNSPSGDKGDG